MRALQIHLALVARKRSAGGGAPGSIDFSRSDIDFSRSDLDFSDPHTNLDYSRSDIDFSRTDIDNSMTSDP